jgi:hypothetical protein
MLIELTHLRRDLQEPRVLGELAARRGASPSLSDRGLGLGTFRCEQFRR